MTNTYVPTMTAGGISATLYHVPSTQEPVPTNGLFDVVVLAANEFELRPRTELARFLCDMWLHGTLSRSVRMVTRGPSTSFRWGKCTEALCFKFEADPMLTSGADPFATGMSLKPDEVEACKALVQELREKARDAHPRKQRTKPAQKRRR